MKLKRKPIAEKYAAEIEALYARLRRLDAERALSASRRASA